MGTIPTAADLFTLAGRALHGEDWQAPLARQLRLDERRVRRIAQAARENRAYPVPPGVMTELQGLLEARAGECRRLFDAFGRPYLAGSPEADA